MDASELKTHFHSLINRFQDTRTLAHFYSIMINAESSEKEQLWNRLSMAEQEELIASEFESLDETQLISNDEMKRKHQKWL